MLTSTSVLTDMFWDAQPRYWHFILWGSQLIILGLAFYTHKPSLWVLACLLVAVISLTAWVYSIKLARVIIDTPISTIASAAQGYVKIKGIISTKPEYIVVATGGLPCVWFRCFIYAKGNAGWERVEQIVSDSIFELEDGSGEPCMVNPEQAEIFTSDRRTWYSDNFHYVEELLFPGQTLCVQGEFASISADNGLQDINSDVSTLMRKWKENKPELLQRFDTNHDGRIDLEEWEMARQAAYKEIAQQNRNIEHQPDIHILSNPKNGQPFVISNFPESKIRLRSLLRSWAYLLIFFITLCAAFWITAEFRVFY